MKFTQLKYFQTVCKYNNLTRAAEELHISQPGLTHVIHELEQEFDLTLFLRQNKGLILTKKGQQFLNETNLLLEQVDSFVSRMKLLGQVNQGIQFGLSPASATLFFPPILQEFHRQYPQVKVDVVENGSMTNHQRVLDGKLDIALLSSDSPMSSAFGSYKIAVTRICLYLSKEHPLAKKKIVSLKDIGGIPLVLLSEDSFLTTNTLKTCAQYKITPKSILTTNQITIIKQLIQNNIAGTLLFHGTIPDDTLYQAIPVQEFRKAYIYLVWNQYNPVSTAVKHLIKAAEKVYPRPVVDSYCNSRDLENQILNN